MTLTKEQGELLNKVGTSETELREVSRKYGKSLLAIRTLARYSRRVAGLLVAFGLAQNYLPTDETDLTNEEVDKTPLAEDEFEIMLYDIHASIRIGENKFDYMVTKVGKDADRLGKYGKKEKVTRIKFKVSRDEVQALKKFLETEADSAGLYYTFPHLTSCMSNVNRAIELNTEVAIPAGIDRSPQLTLGYFRIKKALGDEKISSIYISQADEGSAFSDYVQKPVVSAIDSVISGLWYADFIIAAQIDRTEKGFTVKPAENSQ